MAARDRKTSPSPTTLSLTDSMSENEDWDVSEWRKKFYEFRDSMQCRLQYIRGNIRSQMEQLAKEKEEAEENCRRYKGQVERLQEQMEQLPLADNRQIANGGNRYDMIEELQLEVRQQREEVAKFKRNTNMTIVEQQHLIEQLRRENEVLQQFKSTTALLEEKVRELEAENERQKNDLDEQRFAMQQMPDLLSRRIEEARRSLTNSLVSREFSPPPIPPHSSLSGSQVDNEITTTPDCLDEEDPDYQEIERDHQAIYAPRQVPPAVEMKRKKFHASHGLSSETSMASRSSELLVTAAATSVRNSHRRSRSPAITGSSREKSKSPAPSVENEPDYAHAAFIRDACATLPRQKRQSRPSQLDIAFKGTREWRGTSANRRLSKPPTPPLRKVASWEEALYSLAECNGLKCETSSDRASNLNLIQPAQTVVEDESLHSAISGVDRRTTVPVFSVLKGRATRIHNISVPHPNCDSSDEEDSNPLTLQTVASPAAQKSTSFVYRADRTSSTSLSKKRVVSSNPSSGGASDVDYAQVAVEVSSCSDSEEPDEKVQRCESPTFDTRSLQRSACLLKLGSKLKWKKVYCCVKCFVLICCKNEADIVRPKNKDCLTLDANTRVRWVTGASTFHVSNAKCAWTLACDSNKDCRRWVKVIQNIVRKKTSDNVLQHNHRSCQGRLIRAARGRRRTVWALLAGHYLLFYRDSTDKLPLKTINVDQARIEDVDESIESDCGATTDSSGSGDGYKSLSVWPAGSRVPTYLLFVSEVEKDAWRSALSVAAGGGEGTEFEKLINDLQAAQWASDCSAWKRCILVRSDVSLSEPLTSIPDQVTRNMAIEMYKYLIHFIHKPFGADQNLDFHVEKIQTIIQMCLDVPQLQDELFCQLIKLTTHENRLEKATGVPNLFCCGSSRSVLKQTNSILDLASPQTPPDTLERSWQLLAFTLSFFLPRRHILMQYLKVHLQKHCRPPSHVLLSTHKFSAFSLSALSRAQEKGGRLCRPSYVEVMSFSRHKPFEHSMPHSIAVSIMDGQHKVVSFDGSTTVAEFSASLNVALKLPPSEQTGFALFADFSVNDVEYCPSLQSKLCDVLSQWEQAYGARAGMKFIRGQTARLVFKNRLYWSKRDKFQTEQERYLLAYQANDDVRNGRFPISREMALSLAALMAQITLGPYSNESTESIPDVMKKFFPSKYRKVPEEELRRLEQAVVWKWMKQGKQSQSEYVTAYLNVLRRWKYFGAKLFPAVVHYITFLIIYCYRDKFVYIHFREKTW
ncbi:DgyrCDS6273 [Dimorphilus gyrociliatus]|uniref:DgyrCDS6273 n=1 Tax=Dimorphilus gyrociliatus TaxID=2664684 RepID=A0A7I8VP72_9ANNE|nr:DgyrCDS6273 [Dimorphilus gyrociliatus]